MYIRPHGGRCCGVFHLVGFSDIRYMGVDEAIRYVKVHLRDPAFDNLNRGRLIEACVTDVQMAGNPNLIIVLDRLGFVNVTSFRNSNSGNTVHVYHAMLNGIDRTPNAPARIYRFPFLKYFTRIFRR